MTWTRRWRPAILCLLLLSGVGCSSWRTKPAVVFSDRELPVWVTKGQTLTAPFDGYFMQDGVLFTCERQCIRHAMGLTP
jgi:hypothetical protein